MTEPASEPHPQSKRQLPKRLRPAQISARALNSRHRRFADLVLSGLAAGTAYERISKARGDSADVQAAVLLRRPKVASYIAAVRDQSVADVVLNQNVLHGRALAIARGDVPEAPPSL